MSRLIKVSPIADGILMTQTAAHKIAGCMPHGNIGVEYVFSGGSQMLVRVSREDIQFAGRRGLAEVEVYSATKAVNPTYPIADFGVR